MSNITLNENNTTVKVSPLEDGDFSLKIKFNFGGFIAKWETHDSDYFDIEFFKELLNTLYYSDSVLFDQENGKNLHHWKNPGSDIGGSGIQYESSGYILNENSNINSNIKLRLWSFMKGKNGNIRNEILILGSYNIKYLIETIIKNITMMPEITKEYDSSYILKQMYKHKSDSDKIVISFSSEKAVHLLYCKSKEEVLLKLQEYNHSGKCLVMGDYNICELFKNDKQFTCIPFNKNSNNDQKHLIRDGLSYSIFDHNDDGEEEGMPTGLREDIRDAIHKGIIRDDIRNGTFDGTFDGLFDGCSDEKEGMPAFGFFD